MIPRKRIDIGWSDLAGGMLACITPGDAAQAAKVETAWHTVRANLACLSVRSGFDALLGVLQLPAGSEVLVSALTIRDMTRIIEAHGLVAVPVDLDIQTLAVTRASLEHAISPRTRAVLVAHLYGSRMPMRDIVYCCNKKNILLIEDCAQAYTGDGWRGDAASDVCLFSFGPIKTATALGGAVMTFRDRALRERVRAYVADWPLQPRMPYFARLLKYALFKVLGYRLCYTLFMHALRLVGMDHERVLAASVHGFGDREFFTKIRRRPSLPLLAMLRRRIAQGMQPSVARRSARARQLAELLPAVRRPGALASWHAHWVFPVLHPRADALIAHLQAQGFDATRGASSMAVVVATQCGMGAATGANAANAFAMQCYLPAHEGMSAQDIERLAGAVREFEADAVAGDWRAA
jgi:dTDP-4-amino-4,6-dideoxygalactose transaminase